MVITLTRNGPYRDMGCCKHGRKYPEGGRTWIRVRSDGVFPSGTTENPYREASGCQNDNVRLWEVYGFTNR